MNSKRILEDSTLERPTKMPFKGVAMEEEKMEEKEFQFRVLLPNSSTIELKMSELSNEIQLEKFLESVKKEHDRLAKKKTHKSTRIIDWDNKDVHFTDEESKEIRSKINLCEFMPNKWHFLWMHDGSTDTEEYEGLWDLNEYANEWREHLDDYTTETSVANPMALPTLRTPKLEQEEEIPTSSAIISQMDPEGENLFSSAMTMTAYTRKLESLRHWQLHAEREIQELQVESRPLFFKTPSASEYLMKVKSELVNLNKLIDEENEAYRRAFEKFVVDRDKYKEKHQTQSDVPSDERPATIDEGPVHVLVDEPGTIDEGPAHVVVDEGPAHVPIDEKPATIDEGPEHGPIDERPATIVEGPAHVPMDEKPGTIDEGPVHVQVDEGPAHVPMDEEPATIDEEPENGPIDEGPEQIAIDEEPANVQINEGLRRSRRVRKRPSWLWKFDFL